MKIAIGVSFALAIGVVVYMIIKASKDKTGSQMSATTNETGQNVNTSSTISPPLATISRPLTRDLSNIIRLKKQTSNN